MRTMWASWDVNDEARAEAAARAGFDSLKARTRHFLTPLPYYGAYAEYEEHVAGCAVCKRDVFSDCPEGAEMLDIARTGITEQGDLALSN